jgi:hypothetical protein
LLISGPTDPFKRKAVFFGFIPAPSSSAYVLEAF